MDLRFLDPNGQPTREAFNERFEFLNDLTPRIGNISNEYVWEKIEKQYSWTEEVTNAVAITSYNSGTKLYLGDSFHVENGLFVLDNPVLVTLSTSVNPQTVLVGKYACVGWGTQDSIVFYYANTGTYQWSGTVLSIPAKGRIQYSDIVTTEIPAGYVNAPDVSAYPPAVYDGFVYKLLGQLGEKVRIATGSYVGTGKTGRGNINNITFPFEPKLVIISRVEGLNPSSGFWQHSAIWHKGNTKVIVQSSELNVTATENTISFYTTNTNAYAQLNGSGETYYYFAIG